MKRVFLWLIALLLILPCTAAHADDNPMRTLTVEADRDGDTVDVRFIAEMEYPTDTAAFESIDFVLTYAKDVLEPIELVKTDGTPESDILDSSFYGIENSETAGRFEYHAASALGHRGSGLLLHIRFRVIGEGGYGFRVKREGYSVYDAASNKSESYCFALLRDGTVNIEETPKPEEPLPTETPEPEQPEKGWFMRLIESIFGSSCTGGR